MKVIINATGYVGQSGGAGGAGVFLQHLVSRLSRICDVDVLVAPKKNLLGASKGGARLIELPYLTGETFQQLRVGPTVVLDPFGGLPCESFPPDMGLCIVIHDLMHLERPQYFTEPERRGRSGAFALALTRADAVVVFSEDQASAVRRFYPRTQPVVIPHLPYMTLGAAAAGTPLPDLGRYVLFPGVSWPHKNHRTLVQAFGAFSRLRGSDLRLVMCGGPCAENRFSFYPAADDGGERVVNLGRVDDGMLRSLFEGAEAVLFPTLYEGFGIPVLEAAHLGKMVVASALPVFDEILGPTGYRRVADPLCQLRWVDALTDVEGPARTLYEAQAARLSGQTDEEPWLQAFSGVLGEAARRYTSPGLYRAKEFPEGDRLTTSVAATLSFSDIHGAAAAERGPREQTIGARLQVQPTTIFRSAGTSDRRSCIRASYALAAGAEPLEFSAWVRLLDAGSIDRLHWSVNDGNVINLLPSLRDGDWRLVRAPVPPSGYIDFRGVRGGANEVTGFDLEIHDAAVVRAPVLPSPKPDPSARNLTVVVEAVAGPARPDAGGGLLDEVVRGIEAVDEAVGEAAASLRWIVVTNPAAAADRPTAAELPTNVQVRFVAREPFERPDAAGLLSPYEPLARLLLLEAEDLAAVRSAENLAILTAAHRFTPLMREDSLVLDRTEGRFWRAEERGRVMSGLEARVGEPLPPLDPSVVEGLLDGERTAERPRFAVIETDRTSSLSHHGAVTAQFLDGARELGFQPVLGLNREAEAAPDKDLETFRTFSSYVYQVGSAETFAAELAAFVASAGLTSDDIVFMHSLSPQIVLGAARYIAANPETSPRFAMRFFSTAEAMGGHKLSYVKILRSIEAVECVRRRMTFFGESRNLVDYYEKKVGKTYPLLFNPEHPALRRVRESRWFDPGLGAGRIPTLAYFGEAREEKGFDEIPGIVAALLADQRMSEFRFLIQVGSNTHNSTPKIGQAREILAELRRKHPDRVRTFESVESAEQFYFLMKHVDGILAPYQVSDYGRRGTGVTLEALQMGLEVFTWADTDLYATFAGTARVVGVRDGESFAAVVAAHCAGAKPAPMREISPPIRLSPSEVCERLLTFCVREEARIAPPVLWVGNDTFGEGCSAVYSAQKQAVRALGRDCFELFVPWPDRNWAGVDPAAWDEKIYGFESLYESQGLAWVARPSFDAEMSATLSEIERRGAMFGRLRRLSEHYLLPETFPQALARRAVNETVLNYAHLGPVIEGLTPIDGVVCETHDVMAYANAARRGGDISVAEKIEEFSELGRLPRIIAISAEEQREMAGACASSTVLWRLPPYMPEKPPEPPLDAKGLADVRRLRALGGVPDDVGAPSAAMLRAWFTRPDVQKGFGLETPDGRLALFRWWFFWGQFESTGGFDLSERQFEWLTTSPAGQPDGMSRLLLSIRDELAALDAVALRRWEETDARRELGFGRQDLMERGRPAVRPGHAERSGHVASAVLDADPVELSQLHKDVPALFDRLADLQGIDMVLVGSSHPSNLESFGWFLAQVFLPFLAPRGRKLFIAGTAAAAFAEAPHPSVILLGRCTRIEPLMRLARACPLPIVQGSGSPIKTIPALAVNGAVTVTDHVERAFGLADYGIPSFDDPREFADDVWELLVDDARRTERQARAAKYVADKLSLASYVDFWRALIAPGQAAKDAVSAAKPARRSRRLQKVAAE